jgi:hypothetical protein
MKTKKMISIQVIDYVNQNSKTFNSWMPAKDDVEAHRASLIALGARCASNVSAPDLGIGNETAYMINSAIELITASLNANEQPDVDVTAALALLTDYNSKDDAYTELKVECFEGKVCISWSAPALTNEFVFAVEEA